MELLIIGICFVVLIALIIFGAVSSSKKRKQQDVAHYQVVAGYDEALDQPILCTLEKEGYLFARKDTGQDVSIKNEYPVGKSIELTDKETKEKSTKTISRVNKHYEPSMAVSGECWIYNIYFKEYENKEFPVEMDVIKNNTIDKIVFDVKGIQIKKDNQVVKSFDYSDLKGTYYNDYLKIDYSSSDSKGTGSFYINPGKGGVVDNKIAPDKYYVSSDNFNVAKHLVWKYVS